MAALKARLVGIRQETAPGGKLAQACDDALGQWSRWEEYLHDGRVEIDNNWCEGAMRPLALGRKNWLLIGSVEAGPEIAAIASIVETCRRLDLNVRSYLFDILPNPAQILWGRQGGEAAGVTADDWTSAIRLFALA